MSPVRIAAAAAILLAQVAPAHAHRVDAYLQAATISLARQRIEVDVRLIPGMLVWPDVRASIDGNRDGSISPAEAWAYGEAVRADLTLAIDGKSARLRLLSASASEPLLLQEGMGELRLRYVADVARGGSKRTLQFENRHRARIGTYLANCLVPADAAIHVVAQDRDPQQSRYRLEYADDASREGSLRQRMMAWLAAFVGRDHAR